MKINNERLAAVILPWAKDKYPERYQQTLAVASKPDTFQRYMVRLVELRWKEEPDTEWLLRVPLTVLEETDISLKARLFGREVVVCGKKVLDRTWSFGELYCLMIDPDKDSRRTTVEDLIHVKHTFDLRTEEVNATSNG